MDSLVDTGCNAATENDHKKDLNLNMNWEEHIGSDKEVLSGKPAIKGTRISVVHIVGLLAQGWTEEEILENFPRLTKESLQAVFAYIFQKGQRLNLIN